MVSRKRTKVILSILLTGIMVLGCLFGAKSVVHAENGVGPILRGCRFKQDKLSRPGVIQLELDVYDADYPITFVTVSVKCIDSDVDNPTYVGGCSQTGSLWVFDDKITIDILADENDTLGTYIVSTVSMTDTGLRDNTFSTDYYENYGMGETNVDFNDSNVIYSETNKKYFSTELTDGVHKAYNSSFTLVDDMNYSDKFSAANPKIAERIANVPDGHSVGLYMDKSSVVPKAAFDAIAGRDVNIVTYSYYNGIRWVFNGKNIKNPTKDVDVSIEINQVSGKGYGIDDDVIVLKFASNGLLPGKANVRIKSDYLYYLHSVKGNLYLLYNNDDQYVCEDNANIKLNFDGIDKWCSFDVTHNSEYIISSNKNIKKTQETAYSNEWIDGKWYDSEGNQNYEGTLGWKNNSSGWWVEDTAGWYPVSSWQKIDGYWYYFDASGYMVSSAWQDGCWLSGNGAWEYEPIGSWKGNNTGWWFEDTSGWYPYSQWLKINGSWYYFDGSGYMVTNQYIAGYWIGADGVCQ